MQASLSHHDLSVAMQLVALSIFIFGLACVGVFYPYNRGGLYTALIVLYALTAGIAGYTAGSYYKQMEGSAWVRNILLTSVVFCGPLFLMFCVNNTVAIIYRVSPSLPLMESTAVSKWKSVSSAVCCFA
jgi:transmembrane 9 superfamily protein 1